MSKGVKTNGKGDKPRPISISSQEYADNWELAFGKKKIKKVKKISISQKIVEESE